MFFSEKIQKLFAIKNYQTYKKISLGAALFLSIDGKLLAFPTVYETLKAFRE
jgi:hypothetical protein